MNNEIEGVEDSSFKIESDLNDEKAADAIAYNDLETETIFSTEAVDTQRHGPISTESVIHDYFHTMNDALQTFFHYDSVSRSIDFLKLRRFLLTTYNNLVDLDLGLKKTAITDILNDLNVLSERYDSFRQKSKHVKRAFHELFLNRHDEFVKAQNKLDANKSSIAKHDTNITIAEAAIAKLNHIALKTPVASSSHAVIDQRIKKARTVAADEIHRKRALEEENSQLLQFTTMIINENEESFTVKYVSQAKIFDQKIIDLLNKLAYAFDASLWKEARNSNPIKEYFKESMVKGALSSLTYLKYYLQSLNKENLSEDQRGLIELVPYLEALHRRSVLYFSAEIENAMRLKSVISSIDKYMEIETTLHYDKTVESINKKIPDFIFIDQQIPDLKVLIKALNTRGALQNSNVILVVENASESFLEQVRKIHIRYLLPTQVSPRIFSQTLTRILDGD